MKKWKWSSAVATAVAVVATVALATSGAAATTGTRTVRFLAPVVAAHVSKTASRSAVPTNDLTGHIKLDTNQSFWLSDQGANFECDVNGVYVHLESNHGGTFGCFDWTAERTGTVTSTGPFTNTRLDQQEIGNAVYKFTVSPPSNGTEYLSALYGSAGTSTGVGDTWVADPRCEGYVANSCNGFGLVAVGYSDTESILEYLSAPSPLGSHPELFLREDNGGHWWQGWWFPGCSSLGAC